MKVSVVIPTYNGAKKIGACLQALKKQDFGEPFDIIVVDDGSTDGSRALVEINPGDRSPQPAQSGPGLSPKSRSKRRIRRHPRFYG